MTSFFRIKVCSFCIFFENDKVDLCQFFFEYRRKRSFITTCIEKNCTWPLSGKISLKFDSNSSLLLKYDRKSEIQFLHLPANIIHTVSVEFFTIVVHFFIQRCVVPKISNKTFALFVIFARHPENINLFVKIT